MINFIIPNKTEKRILLINTIMALEMLLYHAKHDEQYKSGFFMCLVFDQKVYNYFLEKTNKEIKETRYNLMKRLYEIAQKEKEKRITPKFCRFKEIYNEREAWYDETKIEIRFKIMEKLLKRLKIEKEKEKCVN